jgi:hypothetical protein
MTAADSKHRAAFLVGRLDAYRRGSLTANHVCGAVRAAHYHGVGIERITTMLRAYGLRWNTAADSVEPDPVVSDK